jgi:hypothetical protein
MHGGTVNDSASLVNSPEATTTRLTDEHDDVTPPL